MDLSTLIQLLQDIESKYGNIHVLTEDGWNIYNLSVEKPAKVFHDSTFGKNEMAVIIHNDS